MTTWTPSTLHCQFSQESQPIPIKAIMGRETHGNPMSGPQDEEIGWFMEDNCAFWSDREGRAPTQDVVPNITLWVFLRKQLTIVTRSSHDALDLANTLLVSPKLLNHTTTDACLQWIVMGLQRACPSSMKKSHCIMPILSVSQIWKNIWNNSKDSLQRVRNEGKPHRWKRACPEAIMMNYPSAGWVVGQRGPREPSHQIGYCDCCWLHANVRWYIFIVEDTIRVGWRKPARTELGAPSLLAELYSATWHYAVC